MHILSRPTWKRIPYSQAHYRYKYKLIAQLASSIRLGSKYILKAE